jgi:MYXO-CTERM domain-containing protein
MVAVVALVVMALPQAHAAGVSGQGTWETTLQGRDLDGNAATFEAYHDTVLDITWLADANYAKTSGYDTDGFMAWDDAQTWVAQLNINGVTGWRLPDVKPVNGSSFNYDYSSDGSTDYGYNITSTQSELAHLFYVTLGNKGTVDALGNNPPDSGLSNTGAFNNVQKSNYWSGVTYSSLYPAYAWAFVTGRDGWDSGGQNGFFMASALSAWAVHSGDVGAAVTSVPEPQTYALALAGLAAAALMARKRRA